MTRDLDPSSEPRHLKARGRISLLLAYASMARPHVCLTALGGTVMAGRLADPDLGLGALLLLASSNTFLCAASMMINDWHDVAEDSINAPERPLPSRRTDRRSVLIASCAIFALTLVTAGLAGPRYVLPAFGMIVLSVMYTARLKGVPWVGNGIVAVVSTYPLWCWLDVKASKNGIYLALVAGCLCFRFGSELIRTAADVAGDAAVGIRTVATTRGPIFADRAGTLCLYLGLLFCWLPVIHREATVLYLALLLLSSLVAVALGSPLLFRSVAREATSVVRLERLILVLMAIAYGVGLGTGPDGLF